MKERNRVKGWKIKLRFGERGLPPIESGPQCGRLCSGIPSQFLGAKSLKLPSLKQEPASTSFRKNCLMDKKEHAW